MAITPNGSPAWVRNADHTVYGGNVQKTNFHSQGVTNPRTDVGAEGFVRLAADLAAVARTAPFSSLTVLCNDSAPAAPTIEVVDQMTGLRVFSYEGDAAPPGYPSGARNGAGDVTITWDASYEDAYGVSGDIDIQHPLVTVHGTTPVKAVCELLDPDINLLNEAVRVRCFTFPGGAATSNARFSLEVA